MALPILDGNQSATTLSTILSSGQHIPAHTVVSLGTQAITDMRGAVSGSVVSISNFPATQPVSIASVTIGNTVTIAGTVTANPTGTQTIAGTVTANVTGDAFTNTQGGIAADDGGGVQPNFGVQLGYFDGNDYRLVKPSHPLPISGAVTVGNSVTIASLPAISGTVTANIGSAGRYDNGGDSLKMDLMVVRGQDAALFLREGGGNVPISGTVTANLSTTVSPSISSAYGDGDRYPVGTTIIPVGGWTAEIDGAHWQALKLTDSGELATVASLQPSVHRIGVVTIGAGTVTLGAGTSQIGSVTASISGTVPVSISSVTVGNSVTIGSLPAISGTVTANSSNGSLTTRFGSVTTANTAFATSAVTNANRKYLLIQNVTTASNVITVGVGFTPTTTQGIQLTAGAGLTFEGNYIPTGAVNLLSSVTASCFTILEA